MATKRPGRPAGKPLSEAERARNIAAAGRQRGRWANTEERAVLDQAKAKLRLATPEAVDFMLSVMRGEVEGATIQERVRAAENISDRGGLPRRAEHEVDGGAFPIIVVDGGLNWPEKASE